MVFYYKGTNRRGEIVEKTIDANSAAQAIATLQMQGLTGIKLSKTDQSDTGGIFSNFKKPSYWDLFIFFRQFSAFKAVGYPLNHALTILADSSTNNKLKAAVYQIRDLINNEAVSLEEAFARTPIFPKMCSAMIKAGNEAGKPEQALERISDNLRNKGQMEQKYQEAVIWPKITLVLLGIATYIIMGLVVPRYEKLFSSLRIQLPWVTQLVIDVVRFVSANSVVITTLVVLGAFGFIWFKKNHPDKYEQILFNLPIYKSVYRSRLMYNFTNTMYLLRVGGIKPVDALPMTASAMESVVIEKIFDRAIALMKDGMTLTNAIKNADKEKWIDKVTMSFLIISEEAGKGDDILKEAAEYYREMLEAHTAMFPRKFVPVVLFPIGGLVAIVLLAVYWPMFALSKGV